MSTSKRSYPQFYRLLACLCLALLTSCSTDPEKKFADAMAHAKRYKEEKKWDEARVSIIAALSAKPKNAEAHFELAETLVSLRKYPQAVEAYETALNLDPSLRDARAHLAALLLAGGQTELAESHITKVLEKHPDYVEGQILKGNALASRRDFAGARKVLLGVVEKNKENSAALASLGQIALLESNLQEAEDFFVRSLKTDGASNPVRLALADLYMKQGRTDEAQGILQNLVNESPENTSLRYFFGELLLAKGQTSKAEEQYVEMLKTDPRRFDARDRLYDMYIVQKKKDQALELTKTLAAKFPDDPGTQYFRGRDAELEGNLEGAREKFLGALDGMHNFAPLFRRLGLVELRLGQTNEALEHLNQAVVLNATDVGARLALAQHLFLRKEYAQSREHVDRLLKAFPRQLGANILKADLALMEGDLDTADKIYNALIQTLPDSGVGYFKLALLEERRKNTDKAIELYKKGISFDQDIFVALRRLATVLAQKEGPEKAFAELTALKEKSAKSKPEFNVLLGSLALAQPGGAAANADKAKGFFMEAINENPNFLAAYMALAQIDQGTGNYASAEQNYLKVVQAQPKQIPSRMLLAMTYERQGKLQQAADEYKEIMQVAPRFAPAANNLAWLLANDLNGDLEEALRLALVAKEGMPKESSVADTLAWVYHKKGSSRAALPIIEEAVELARDAGEGKQAAPVAPEILYHLGVIRESTGDKEGAKQALNDALQAPNGFPSKAEAEELLKKLS